MISLSTFISDTHCHERILETAGTVSIPGITSPFVARYHFVANLSDTAPVKLSYIGDDFNKWFLYDDGLIEGPQKPRKLGFYQLRAQSFDRRIIDSLGGRDRVVTSLASIFFLMQKQQEGKLHALLPYCANIFYALDRTDCLRAVGVSMHNGGWSCGASDIHHHHPWLKYRRVFAPV